MSNAIRKSLYRLNRESFRKIKSIAMSINAKCNGNNIIQDDIFNVVKNYGRQEGQHVEILRYPVDDDEFLACTFLRQGTVFIFCNSHLPLSKQIFAMGHEMYHLFKHIEGADLDFQEKGSILKAQDFDSESFLEEDIEANAFSGLLLAPPIAIREQMEIYGISSESISPRSVLRLMDIFAIPYKAMIIRLLEENIIDEEDARVLIQAEEEEIDKKISITGIAKRWQSRTNDIEIGSLEELMDTNESNMFVLEERVESDRSLLKETLEKLIC